jgi:hypothetical protein
MSTSVVQTDYPHREMFDQDILLYVEIIYASVYALTRQRALPTCSCLLM